MYDCKMAMLEYLDMKYIYSIVDVINTIVVKIDLLTNLNLQSYIHIVALVRVRGSGNGAWKGGGKGGKKKKGNACIMDVGECNHCANSDT